MVTHGRLHTRFRVAAYTLVFRNLTQIWKRRDRSRLVPDVGLIYQMQQNAGCQSEKLLGRFLAMGYK